MNIMKHRGNKLGYGLVVVLMLVMVVTGCKSKKEVSLTPSGNTSEKEIYQKAKAKMRKDPDKARLLFKEIMHLYPDSTYAGRAKLGIADSYFKQKDSGSLIMAAAEYQEFVNMYPNSPDAVYSKYQIGMCYYKQMKKPGRDQTNTHEAIKAFQALIKVYPDTEEAQDAKKKISEARQNLAQHYYNIGHSNYLFHAYRGAVVRFKQVIDDYPEFEKMDRLLFYAGKSYFQMRDFDTAISFFQRVIGSYPKSKFNKKSQKMIKKINDLISSGKFVKRKKKGDKEDGKKDKGAEIK